MLRFFFRQRRPTRPRITTDPDPTPRVRGPGPNGRGLRAPTDGLDDAFAAALARLLSALESHIAQAGAELQTGVGAHLNELTDAIRVALESACATLPARLHAEADEIRAAFVPQAVEAFNQETAKRWESLAGQVNSLVDATARQALHAPVVNQTLALHDRILAEMAYQAALYRRLEATALDPSLQMFHEHCEAAQRSYVTELLMHLAALGVQKLESRGGPLNPRRQLVVDVEPTSNPELDGHVARIVSAGFTWNGAIHRPEKVVAYKLEQKK